MRELTFEEMDAVSGAMSDTEYATSVGAAIGLLAIGAAAALVPGGVAGTIAMWSTAGSILSSSYAICYATQ